MSQCRRFSGLYGWTLLLLLSTAVGRPGTADSPPDPDLDQQEQQQCTEQLRRIHEGIVRFQNGHHRFPYFLSELVPNYCRQQDLACPAKGRVGAEDWARQRLLDEALHDPNCETCNYSYEFIEKLWRGTTVTYREYKNAQRDFLDLRAGTGATIPIVRCFLHGRKKVLNLTLSGQVRLTGIEWEDDTPWHRELIPGNLLPRAVVALSGRIPPRPDGQPPGLVDLSLHYNATIDTAWYKFPLTAEGSFAQLLQSPRFPNGIRFDVRGVIQLKGGRLHRPFPLKSDALRVLQKAERLGFLIGSYGAAETGTRIAQIECNYEDTPSIRIDLIYGIDLLDWRVDPATVPSFSNPDKVGWIGETLSETGRREPVWLYCFQWINPRPLQPIVSINFNAVVDDGVLNEAAPALFGITLED